MAVQNSSTFRTALTPSSNFQWTYDYLQQPQLVTLTSVTTPKHRLSFAYDWSAPNGGSVFVNSTQGLDVNQSSTSASVSMPLRIAAAKAGGAACSAPSLSGAPQLFW